MASKQEGAVESTLERGEGRGFAPSMALPMRPLAPVGTLFVTAAVVLAPAALLFLFWQGRTALFLLFASILFAVALDAATRGLGRIVPLDRPWRLGIVIAAVVALAGAAVWFGGALAIGQAGDLLDAVRAQANELSEFFSRLDGERAPRADEAMSLADLGRKVGAVLGGAGGDPVSAAQSVLGIGANTFFIFFMGCFLALAPRMYRDGTALLAPPRHRETVGEALDGAGETLRNWLLGKLCAMALIGVLTTAGLWLVSFPYAVALGVLAGLLAFVPNIGPILFYVPLVLVGMSAGSTTLLWGIGIYLVAQTVESYLFTPFVQSRMVVVPPALIFFMQLFAGVLFGAWGVALATPLTAVALLWVRRYYIESFTQTA